MMRSFAPLAALCLSLALATSAELPAGLPKALPQRTPDLVRQKDRDEWYGWYFHKGTRSEALVGALRVDGAWLIGKKKGETVTCSLGNFAWQRPWSEPMPTWGVSGWVPKNIKEVYPSWQVADKPSEPE